MLHFRICYYPLEVCRAVVEERLAFLKIPFNLNSTGELNVNGTLTDKDRYKMHEALKPYNIKLVEKGIDTVVEGIKSAIEELLDQSNVRTEKISSYLSKKLGYSYSLLSNRFSEETHTSIENFIILQRIERVKRLMLLGDKSLTEIAQTLDYSSVAHLSRQFKKTTGLTPTIFLRIIKKRNKT